MIFTPVSTRKFDFLLDINDYRLPKPRPVPTAVNHVSAIPWLDALGLLDHFKYTKHRFACLYGWFLYNQRIDIHRDFSHNGDAVPWSLVAAPVGHGDLIMEIYEPKEGVQLEIINAPPEANIPAYPIEKLPFESAVKIDEWCLNDGPVIFNPGKYWHSVHNPTDKVLHAISLRSHVVDDATIITSIFK